MKVTGPSEKGLEALIVESLVSETGYEQGRSEDYDRDHAVDAAKLLAFLTFTQPKAVETLGLAEEGPSRTPSIRPAALPLRSSAGTPVAGRSGRRSSEQRSMR